MFEVNEVNAQSIEFGLDDFRAYNNAGFEELQAALELALRRFQAADTLQEREVCQARLDSLEQLWRLSRQLACERFEHARDAAAASLNRVIARMRQSQLPSRTRSNLWEQLSVATAVFAQKQFSQVMEQAAAVEAASMRPPRRRLGIALPDSSLQPDCANNVSGEFFSPGPVLVSPVGGDPIDLLEGALEFERQGRGADACRLYLKVLERQPGNPAARRAMEMSAGD